MKKHRGRNAGSGEFMSVKEAEAAGAGAVVETVGSKPKRGRRVGRDAGDGRFLGVDEAARRGSAAIVERR